MTYRELCRMVYHDQLQVFALVEQGHITTALGVSLINSAKYTLVGNLDLGLNIDYVRIVLRGLSKVMPSPRTIWDSVASEFIKIAVDSIPGIREIKPEARA